MSRNYYSEINLHVTWHTIGSRPLLTSQIETETHRYLRQRIIDTPGVFVHEIGGTETHVHMALSIPPTLTISDYIGQLKGHRRIKSITKIRLVTSCWSGRPATEL